MKNIPYVKTYKKNKQGVDILVNPITKQFPYLHQNDNRDKKSENISFFKKAHKKQGIVITRGLKGKFFKFKKFNQLIRDKSKKGGVKVVAHYQEC